MGKHIFPNKINHLQILKRVLAGALWRGRGLVAHAATRRFRPQGDPSLDPARSALGCPPNTRARAGDAAGHPAAALWVARFFLGEFWWVWAWCNLGHTHATPTTFLFGF